jgi:uncharacterized protein
MIYSKYNFQFKSEKYGNLLYNSLTNCFVELEEDTALSLQDYQNGKLKLDATDIDIEQLYQAKILVDNNYDEFLNIKFQKHMGRFDRSRMSLTIAPTLHCNLSCEYCYEKSRPNVYMTDQTEDQIIQFIKLHSEVKRLSITWYGGEPLLDFGRIKTLTKKISELNIEFSASIITNGYLLTKEVIDQFIELRIKPIQVTIDGPKDIHNKRRPHIKTTDSFSVIYNNILNLRPYLKDNRLSLSVRVNIDKGNSEYFNSIYKTIRKDFKDLRVLVYPGIVKNSYGSCSSVEDIQLDNQSHADFNIEQYRNYGINSLDFFPVNQSGECIARQIYGYLIDASGDIYKCWTDIGNKSEVVGNVGNQELVNTTLMMRYLTGADVFDRKECQECLFLPVCGGGCPHLALKKIMGQNTINLCHVAKDNLKDFLEIYYEIKNNIKPAV